MDADDNIDDLLRLVIEPTIVGGYNSLAILTRATDIAPRRSPVRARLAPLQKSLLTRACLSRRLHVDRLARPDRAGATWRRSRAIKVAETELMLVTVLRGV
jgi:hypothetical protein